ncbi:hypothetical protein Noda2021_05620 [Candidatus Dependentiae bacterium Noda2021]|nr:hypothetical protein Noda2021_05620 [Candidatus Dependentiae bacterium Noda2021]
MLIVFIFLSVFFLSPTYINTQNPELDSTQATSEEVFEEQSKGVDPATIPNNNSSESYYKAKLKELENNEAAHQAKELRENVGLGLYAVNTALNVGDSVGRLFNYFMPSGAKEAENEKGKNLKMEYKAIRLLSVCMRTHVKGELDEKFHMPKACEKEVLDLLILNPQILAEKQHAFNYMRR